MSRKRQIDPEIWKDPDFIRLTFRQRLLFIGIFSNADDEGLIEADYAHVKAAVFPGDVYQEMEYETDLEMLQQLSGQGKCAKIVDKKSPLVVLYVAEGRQIIWLPKWFRYQVIDHPTRSKLPRPNKKQLHKFNEYYNGWRKYFSDDSESPLRALAPGNSLLSYKQAIGLSSSSPTEEDTEKPDDDPHWSYRCAVGFGRLCETPHLKTKQKWCRDLARQGVPKRAIEEAAMNPKYQKWDFFSITDDLKDIHLNGGASGGRKHEAGKRVNAGAKEVLNHFSLKPGELDEKTRKRIADRERAEGGAKGTGAAKDRGHEENAGERDAVPGS